MNTLTAVIILIINVAILPGLGTAILSCLGPRYQCRFILIGIAQFFLTFVLVGYIWGIITGIQAINSVGTQAREVMLQNETTNVSIE
jgi:hypothetical protein